MRILVEHIDDKVTKRFFSIQEGSWHNIAILHGDNDRNHESRSSGTRRARFLGSFENLLDTVEVVAISVGLPAGLPVDFIYKLSRTANHQGKPVVLDCSGAALQAVLESPLKPTVIKQIT